MSKMTLKQAVDSLTQLSNSGNHGLLASEMQAMDAIIPFLRNCSLEVKDDDGNVYELAGIRDIRTGDYFIDKFDGSTVWQADCNYPGAARVILRRVSPAEPTALEQLQAQAKELCAASEDLARKIAAMKEGGK